jgi:hypothetical protein
MFKQGNEGRPKGATNRTTRRVRELLSNVLEGELEDLENLLNTLTPYERLNVVVKLLPYVLPKCESKDVQSELQIRLIDDED